MGKINEQEKADAIKRLKAYIERSGRVVFSKTNHVSNSGMMRAISFYAIVPLTKKEQKAQTSRGITPKVQILNLDYLISRVLSYKQNSTHDGLTVNGCGMDMHFSVVYHLGGVLFYGGDGKTVTGRNGNRKPETDGGYLLENRKL